MNSSIAPAAALLLALSCASSARAEICPRPSPEARRMLDNCETIDACRTITRGINNCSLLISAISGYFSAKKQPLDTDEFKTERYLAPGPSEIEQNRKDAKLINDIRVIDAGEAKSRHVDWSVNDPRLVALLKQWCADPLDSLCQTYVGEAKALGARVKIFNDNPAYVAIYGKLTAVSPNMAAEIELAGEKIWQEREARKKKQPATGQPSASLQEAADKKDKLTIDNNLAMMQEQRNQQERDRIKNAAAAAAAADAAAQRAANAAAADKRAAASTDNNDAAAIAAGLGQFIDAYGKLQKAKQDAKQPAPAVRQPPGKGGSGGGGCGGIGATTCK